MSLHRNDKRTVRTPGVQFERLEGRALFNASLGVNLIANPGAEANTGTSGMGIVTPSDWTVADGSPTVIKYGSSGYPSTSSPGPSSRGNNFFAGGPGADTSDLFQTINLSSQASAIDAGHIKFSLSGYLGGKNAETDEATVFVNFHDASNSFLGQVSIGPVTPANRSDVTGLLDRTLNGAVPAHTRSAQIQIHFDRTSGSYTDGYADNLSFVLASTTGSISGTVFNDNNGDAIKQSSESGLGGVKVFVDKFHTGVFASGDPTATTASNGTYTINNVPVGAWSLREIVPSTYRATTANPVNVTVSGGVTTKAPLFGDSQTALITGVVFDDANGDKTQDGTEKGIVDVVVYLDINHNGHLDSADIKTKTDANGRYSFVVPSGTYVVRQVIPSGKTQTTPASGYTLTLSKGQVSKGDNFGDK